MPGGKTCFVISPIGEPDSETRDRADKLFDYVIQPSVEPHGFVPIRADQIAEPGIITSQVIEHVVESPLVIADLTGSNANVFYELAVRHAVQEPLVQLISSHESMPFDVAGTRTIQIDLSDIESVEEAKSGIKEQIESLEANMQRIDTPISVAMDLQNLRESADPDERSMAEIMESLSELRTTLISIQNNLENPEELLPPDYLQRINDGPRLQQGDEMLALINNISELVSAINDTIVLDDSFDEDHLRELLKKLDHNVRELRSMIIHRGHYQFSSLGDFSDYG